MTEKRLKKILSVVSKRQKNLTIVLENIHDPHNVSAILRTCDAVGVDKVYLIYNTNKFPKIGKASSASAKKWIDTVKFDNVIDCFRVLREQGYSIYSTHLQNKNNTILYEVDFTRSVAIVFGNEHSGVSEEVKQNSDSNIIIPMFGMIQSLNVSVSVAVCLYEALRQRLLKGLYNNSSYNQVELEQKLNYYLKKSK